MKAHLTRESWTSEAFLVEKYLTFLPALEVGQTDTRRWGQKDRGHQMPKGSPLELSSYLHLVCCTSDYVIPFLPKRTETISRKFKNHSQRNKNLSFAFLFLYPEEAYIFLHAHSKPKTPGSLESSFYSAQLLRRSPSTCGSLKGTLKEGKMWGSGNGA